MRVNEVMTTKPACCGPETPLREVAHLMVAHDCGEIPVTDAGGQPMGVVTDRDIVVRTLALGLSPMERKASDVMTSPCLTVPEDCSLDECTNQMEKHQVRRMLVVDGDGCVCGIIAQADVALKAGKKDAGELLRDVSKPGPAREPVTI